MDNNTPPPLPPRPSRSPSSSTISSVTPTNNNTNNHNNLVTLKLPSWPPQEWFSTSNNSNHHHPTPPRRLPPPLSHSHPSSFVHTWLNHHQNIQHAHLHPPTHHLPSLTNSLILNQSPIPSSHLSSFQSPLQIIDSPSNTLSFAPLNLQHLPLPPQTPPISLSPSSTLFQNSSIPLHSPKKLHPPPSHPARLPVAPVIETLDAQLTCTQDGYRQVNQYILKQELGRGSFGAVRLAVDAETGLEFAVKEFSKRRLVRKFGRTLLPPPAVNDPSVVPMEGQEEHRDALWLIRNEVAIMKKVKHPNVVKLREVLDVVGEDSLYMVLEYCRGGPIMKLGHQDAFLDMDTIRRYFRQLIVGIDYLHQNMIIHHDIKPDNILLSSDRKQIKIADFGISAIFTKPITPGLRRRDSPIEVENEVEGEHEDEEGNKAIIKPFIGTPAFLSPELIGEGKSGTESDIWAMGVTLYCLVTGGHLPFGKTGEPLDLYRSIREDAPEISDELDPRLIELLARLLDKHASTRITISELNKSDWVTDSSRLSPPINTTNSISKEKNHTMTMINRFNSEDEIADGVRLGFTSGSQGFKEICRMARLRLVGDKGGGGGRGSRREFFKEFYRLLSEKTVLLMTSSSYALSHQQQRE